MKDFKEDLIWMSYRYAIGLPQSREEDFFNVEFDSPEYHALVDEFAKFLKRKYKTLPKMMEKKVESDLIYLSYHYAIGRKTYVTMHAAAIAKYADMYLSENRKAFNALDIRRTIYSHFSFGMMNFRGATYIEDTYCPVDLYMKFINDNNINNIKTLRGYTHVEPVIEDGEIKFITEYDSTQAEKGYFYISDFEEYFPWADLANMLDKKCHKFCKVRYNGKEEVIEYFDSWVRDFSHNVYYEDVIKKVEEHLNDKNIQYFNIDYHLGEIVDLEKYYGINTDNDEILAIRYRDCHTAQDLGIKLYQTYSKVVQPENYFYFKKIKRPVKSFVSNGNVTSYINEDYIIEDDITPEKNI